MTEERLRALYGLVGAVKAWADTPTLEQYTTPMERRLRRALEAVQGCGADVALVVELTGEGVRRLDGKPPA